MESNKTVKTVLILIMVAVIALPLLALLDEDDTALIPIEEPRSGEILSGMEVYDGNEITVTSSRGSASVVKLRTSSGVERLSFYVRAGDTVTVGVPAEYLYVQFASGDTWYGRDQLFGSNTRCSMDDVIVDFSRYSIEYTLTPVTDGNFDDTPISIDEFR